MRSLSLHGRKPGLAMAMLWVALSWATATHAADPKKELEDVQGQIKQAEEERGKLAQASAKLEKEAKALQASLVELASQQQELERQLTRRELEMNEIKTKQAEVEESLTRRHKELEASLAAMTRLARVPAEAWIVQPIANKPGHEALKDAGSEALMIHTAMGLKSVSRYLQEMAQALRKDLELLANLKIESEAAVKALQDERKRYAKSLETIEAKLKEREELRGRMRADLDRAQGQVVELAAKAESLQELMKKLADANEKEKGKPLAGFSGARGKMVSPAQGTLVGKFGEMDELQARRKGVSILTRDRAQVLAPFDGEIVYTGPFMNYGNMVIIRHSEDYYFLLAGMSAIQSRTGERVKGGEPVGRMGGGKDGLTKLYVELRKNNKPVDPLPWISG